MAQSFIQEARREFEVYKDIKNELEYRLACEKAWGAIAQAVMYVLKTPITHHKDFSKIASQMKATGRVDLVSAVTVGDRLHSGGFYHGAIADEALTNALDLIDQTIQKIRSKTRRKE